LAIRRVKVEKFTCCYYSYCHTFIIVIS